MLENHFRLAALSAAILLAGCKGNQPAPTAAPQTLNSSAAPGSSAPAPNPNDDAAALANRTAQYAKDLAPMLDKRGASTEPSIVQWIDPKRAPTPVLPIAPADPTPIRAAAVIPPIPKDDAVPLILPESADGIPPSAPQPTAVAIPTDAYEKTLAQQVKDYPRDIAGQLDYELLRFVRGEPTPDLNSMAGLTSEDREIVSALLDGVSNFRNTCRSDGNQLLSHKIQPLIDMADRLRSQAELTIPTIALCTKVESFGVYRPVSASRFAAGKENDVIVYCEVGNFSSVQNPDKQWETHLKQETVLYTDTGMPVWPEKSNAQSYTDLSRNRRHDFFLARIVKLPANLTIGRYLLKVTLTDEQTNRVAESSAPIEIVAE